MITTSAGSTWAHDEAGRRSGVLGASVSHAGAIGTPTVGVLHPWCNPATWGPGESKFIGWWHYWDPLPSACPVIMLVARQEGLGGGQIDLATLADEFSMSIHQDGVGPIHRMGGTLLADTWTHIQIEMLRSTAPGAADGAVRLWQDAGDDTPPVINATGLKTYDRYDNAWLGYWGVVCLDPVLIRLEQLQISTTRNASMRCQAEWVCHGTMMRAG